MISRRANANPTLVFVMKTTNQIALPIMFMAKTYLIYPKISSLFLDGTHLFGKT